MLRVDWSESALRDIEQIARYIAQHNPIAAISTVDLVTDAAQNLAYSPYIGRIGRRKNTRELVVHPNYILVYKISNDAIRIITVLHTRQRYP